MKTFLLVAVLAMLGVGCVSPPANCAKECASLPLPAPTCSDPNTAVTYSVDLQSCDTGCTTVSHPVRCEFGCLSGMCLGSQPHDAGSDAGLDAGHSLDAGTRDAGPNDAGLDLCANVTCLTPPANRCSDAQHLAVTDVPGTCNQGLCQYSTHTELCTGGCSNGACVNNPCQGITCVTPPANLCDDASTLRTYSHSGTCSAGSCSYTSQTVTCSAGCANGRCVNDPCVGVTCSTPPATVCMGSTRRSYTAPGTCTAGNCNYAPSDMVCPFGCANGACVSDPCSGMTCTTPPASTCFDANTLRTFSPTGACASGTCTYAPMDITCSFGCANGACVNDPCAGMSCTMPPAATCMGMDQVRSYASPGTCANGTCSYTASVQPCPVPSSTCTDAFTQRAFAASCSNGACGSTPTDTYCPGGCTAGACVPVVCTRAQTRSCSADCMCEENLPSDQGLIDLSASAADDIWACGPNGTLVHFDGGTWAKSPSLTTASLAAIFKTTAGTLWAVGQNGAVLRNSDGGWELIDAGTQMTLRAVDGYDTGLYAVGDRGTVAYFNGATWTVRDAGLNVSLSGVAAQGSKVVAVGNINGSTPAAFVLTSSTITATPFPQTVTSALTSVTTSGGYTTAVGFGGTLINFNSANSTWSNPVSMPNAQAGSYFSRIRGGWVLGDRTYSGSGTLWNDVTSTIGTASSVSNGYFLKGGSITKWNGSSFAPVSGGAYEFEDVWAGAANEVWAVGYDSTNKGRVVKWDGTRFSDQAVSGNWGNVALHAISGLSATDAYAVGDDAVLLHLDNQGWIEWEYNPALQIDWLAVHASSPTNVWLAGWERVRRYNPSTGSGTTETLSGFGIINGVFTFSSTEGWTVGATARHRTSTGWTLVPTGTTGVLNAVWGAATNDVWVGGPNGFIARWNGTSFTPVPSGTTATVVSITGRSANDVYFGFSGGILKHWDGTAMRQITTGIPNTRSVEGIWAGSGDELWVVSHGGFARRKSN